jgi:hypothetical protein
MLNPNVSWDDYRQIKKMNPSTLVAGCKSPMHLRRAIEEGFVEETNAMRLGTGIHALLLEPEQFENRFVVMPDYQFDAENVTGKGERSESKATKYYKAKQSQFYQENQGKSVISRHQFDQCLRCIEALNSRPRIRELLESANKEVTVEGVIEGIEFKGRIDALIPSCIIDLKTTADVSPRIFGSRFFKLGYDFKLSIYRELVRQSTEGLREVRVIAQEPSGDYDNCVINVPEEVLDNAFSRVLHVVHRYKQCMQSGVWPGCDDGLDEIDLFVPDYVLHQDLDWSEITLEETEQVEAYF